MSFGQRHQQAREELTRRGLGLATWHAPGGLVSMELPQGWALEWREDHAVATHGAPVTGWLTVHPLPGQEEPEQLLKAWLVEFLGPGAQHLDIKQLGPLPDAPGVVGSLFELVVAGVNCTGVALAAQLGGHDGVVAYWTVSERFHKPLVTSLLLVILGGLRMASALAPDPAAEVESLPAGALFSAGAPSTWEGAASREGRFALRLPPGWQLEPTEEDGAAGWVLLPPGEAEALVVLTSEDLYGDLEDTMAAATAQLDPERRLRPELPARDVETEEQLAHIRLLLEAPCESTPRRVYSVGVTDGASVVHLLAIASAPVLGALLPELAQVAGSLKVLPRPVHAEHMRALTGRWTYQLYPDPRELRLAAEHRFELHPSGHFDLEVEEVFVAPVGGAAPELEPSPRRALRGEWYVVGQRLTLRYEEGAVEVRQIESVQANLALIDGMIWARVKP